MVTSAPSPWLLHPLQHGAVLLTGALSHTPVLTPMLDPKASNCSPIWKASSLVGVRIREWSLWAEERSDCRMGSAKAPVFPEPVSAKPMTSRPKIGQTHTKYSKSCYHCCCFFFCLLLSLQYLFLLSHNNPKHLII